MIDNNLEKKSSTGFMRLVSRLKGNEKGVAALEFAMIAPLMLVLYVGSIELHMSLSADRRVTDLASATADLVAQSADISGKMTNIFEASSSYLNPYGIENLRITVTSICHDKDDKGRVDWSANFKKGGVNNYNHLDEVELPKDDEDKPVLTVRGTSLILAEVEYTLTTPLSKLFARTALNQNAGEAATFAHTMSDHYYLRPRLTDTPSVINTDAGGSSEGCSDSDFTG